MDWTQAITIIATTVGIGMGTWGTMIGMIIHSNNKFDAMQKIFYEEMKDFHGRLVSLEERSKVKV